MKTYWIWQKYTKEGVHFAITLGRQPKGYLFVAHRNARGIQHCLDQLKRAIIVTAPPVETITLHPTLKF